MRIKKQLYSADKLKKTIALPLLFPNRLEWMEVINEFAECPTYWKIPKTYSINEEKIKDIIKIIRILRSYEEKEWDINTQKNVYKDLLQEKSIAPYVGSEKQKLSDSTALIRIIKKLLEYLGLVWINENGFTITKAGETLTKLKLKEAFDFIGNQILKYQFLHISINPSIFVAKILGRVNFKISKEEWILFLNMTTKMEDEERYCYLINLWRSLSKNNQEFLAKAFQKVPRIMEKKQNLFGQVEIYPTPRYLTIEREYSYQRSFILFPFRNYLKEESND